VTDGRHPGQDDRARIEFEQFVRDHYRDVRRHVHDRWPQSDSGSIANEALEKLWHNWENISGEKIAWVKVTAVNLAIDAFRARRADRELLLEPTEMNARMSSEGPASDSDHATIRHALASLPPRFRKAVVMRTLGYPNEDIARVLGCRTESVSSYVSEGRKLLAKELGRRPRRRQRPTRAGNSDRARDQDAGPAAADQLPRNHDDNEEN
jgi:RNA polymerase sigma factor (sigma-70 family)